MLLVEGSDEWGVKAGSEFIHHIEVKPESPMKVNLSLSELPQNWNSGRAGGYENAQGY